MPLKYILDQLFQVAPYAHIYYCKLPPLLPPTPISGNWGGGSDQALSQVAPYAHIYYCKPPPTAANHHWHPLLPTTTDTHWYHLPQPNTTNASRCHHLPLLQPTMVGGRGGWCQWVASMVGGGGWQWWKNLIFFCFKWAIKPKKQHVFLFFYSYWGWVGG